MERLEEEIKGLMGIELYVEGIFCKTPYNFQPYMSPIDDVDKIQGPTHDTWDLYLCMGILS